MIMTLVCGIFYILIVISIPGIGAYMHIDNVTRKFAYGSIIGRLVKTGKMGNEAEIFLGVPYAQPPIGELRFKYPLPPKPRTDIYDATYERPWCIQFWYTDERIDRRPQSEDCLYLTIYVPRPAAKGGEKTRYPVLFWVHGGSYQVGGSNAFPVQGTVDNIVGRGVVFVVINYRLGSLGFMSSLNNNLPGNYGLEDQLAALKFVKENIEFFNGDPDSITIGGESAGASSVGLLSSSPKTKGYFHKVIIRSGSSLAPWSVRTINTDLNTDKVIAGLNCQRVKKLSLTTKNNEQYSSSDEEEARQNENVMNCLRLLDSTDFVQQWRAIAHEDLMMIVTKTANRPVNYNHPFLAHTYFTPVIDGYRLNESILPHYASDMARNNSKLPLMISSMTGECTGYITWLTYLEKVMNINMQDLEYVVPSTQYANAEQVKQAVYKRYIGDALWKSTFNYKKALVDIASDQNFVAPIAEEARFYVENGAPVYVYIFDHGNEDLYSKHVAHGVYDVGSSHGFDMVYLFQSTAVVDPGVDKPIKWNDMDLKVTDFLAQTLYNFVATGNPNPANQLSEFSNFTWPKYTTKCEMALLINGSGTVLSSFFRKASEFWIRTVPLIESLTLRNGYTFEPTPEYCTTIGRFNFRLAFYVLLVFFCFLFVTLMFTCYGLISMAKRNKMKQTTTINNNARSTSLSANNSKQCSTMI